MWTHRFRINNFLIEFNDSIKDLQMKIKNATILFAGLKDPLVNWDVWHGGKNLQKKLTNVMHGVINLYL